MRVLLLTTYFTPDITANGILMSQLAQELVDRGHQVTVVTTMPHFADNRIAKDYRGQLWLHEDREGQIVHRLYLYVPPEKSNVAGRLFGYLSFNVLSTWVMLWTGRHDVLFAPSPPLSNGVMAVIGGRVLRMPVVYNVQDIYPDVAVDLGVLTNPHWVAFFQSMERFVYRHASAVSVISEGFRHNLLAKGVPPAKVFVIPNFVDTDQIRPGPRCNTFRRQHNIEDCFVVLFAGNVGFAQGLETVLEAAQRLRETPSIAFLIVGNGAAKARLMEQADRMGLDNVRFMPNLPFEDMTGLHASADVCLAPLRKRISQDAVPSKLLTIMAAGRPVIAGVDVESDGWRLVQTAQCGICVEPEDVGALAQAIGALYADQELGRRMGENGRRHVQAFYSLGRVADQTEALFVQVAGCCRGDDCSMALS